MAENTDHDVPLFVDLDGTLIKTDMCFETLVGLLKNNLLLFLLTPFWLLRGRAYFKKRLAERVSFNPALLPYNRGFLSFLRQEKDKGRKVVLATASDERVASTIDKHLRLFSGVIASDGKTNRKSQKKLEAIREEVDKGEFDYAGNSGADIVIWKAARRRILVNASARQAKKIARHIAVDRTYDTSSVRGRDLFAGLRMHHFSKNLLLFLPIIMAHEFANVSKLFDLTLAFVSFCLCAGAVYLLNDCIDLEADRLHPLKRKRPLASGKISIAAALGAIPFLAVLSLALAFQVPPAFIWTLLLYALLTTAYSFCLKRVVLADAILLASLYTLRIIAGGVAGQVLVSEWMLGFSVFFFLSLAFAKRYAELYRLGENNEKKVRGRGYSADDLQQIANFGSVSGYLSVLVLALYINSDEMRALYSHPQALWLICPLLLYWISRIWLLAHRGRMLEDPLVFAISDRVSYVIGFFTALLLILGK